VQLSQIAVPGQLLLEEVKGNCHGDARRESEQQLLVLALMTEYLYRADGPPLLGEY